MNRQCVYLTSLSRVAIQPFALFYQKLNVQPERPCLVLWNFFFPAFLRPRASETLEGETLFFSNRFSHLLIHLLFFYSAKIN